MRLALGVLVSLAMIGGVAACTEVSTNPSVVVALSDTGAPIALTPGRTWVSLCPIGGATFS